MEPLSTATIFLLLCLTCLVFFATRHKGSGTEKLPPGPFPLPIIGNLLQLKTNNLPRTLEKLSEKYGSVFTLHFGRERVVVLHGYEAVKEALIDHGDAFAGRGSLPIADKINKGQGILFSNGETWKQVRRFVLTTLRNLGMGKKSIEERIQREAQCLLEEIQNTEGKPFDPTFLLSCAASNVICSIVFGHRYNYKDKQFLNLMHLMNDNMRIMSSSWGQLYTLFPSFMELIPGPHHRIPTNFSTLQQFILDEINEHKPTFEPSAPRDVIDFFFIKIKEDFPSVPLDATGNPHCPSLLPSTTMIAGKKEQNDKTEFSVDNLVNTTLDLFTAGTETTSTTLRYGLLILMKYPEIQEKVQEEIDQVVGRARSPCMADRGQMPYTDAVVHEIQRFISLVPMSLPHAVVKDTPFRQYIIPKGTTIYPFLSSVLNETTEFQNPEEFNPHHFLNEDGTFRKSNYFMPFSAGKRICAGEGMARMELFLFWTTILQNFTLKPLVDPKTLDITPQFSSLGNVPKPYQLRALPR